MVRNLLGRRLGPVTAMQTIMLLLYSQSILSFSHDTGCSPSPWALPFYFMNPFFAMVWQTGVIYYFSDAPFLQQNEMYRMARMGRKRWFWERLGILAVKSLFLILTEIAVSISFLMPQRPDPADGWGSLFYTFSMSNAVLQYNSMASFPYEFLVKYSPLEAILLLLGVGWLLTWFTAILMAAVSCLAGRAAAMGIVAGLALFVVAERNISMRMPEALFVSPVSWLNLNRLGEEAGRQVPVVWALGALAAGIICLAFFWKRALEKRDIFWQKEE